MIINGVEIFRREDDIHYIIPERANKQGPWLLGSNLGKCVLWYIRYILQYRWREKVFKGTCVYRELHQKKRTGVHKSSEYNGKRKRSLFVSRRDNALRYSLSRISFFFYVRLFLTICLLTVLFYSFSPFQSPVMKWLLSRVNFKKFFLTPVTFVFLTALEKSPSLTVPGSWPLCYTWIGYLQANGPPLGSTI